MLKGLVAAIPLVLAWWEWKDRTLDKWEWDNGGAEFDFLVGEWREFQNIWKYVQNVVNKLCFFFCVLDSGLRILRSCGNEPTFRKPELANSTSGSWRRAESVTINSGVALLLGESEGD